MIVDEDTPTCSVAADIAATVGEEAFDYLDAPIMRVQAPHTPVPYARNLELAYIPDANRVAQTVRTAARRVESVPSPSGGRLGWGSPPSRSP